VLNRRRKDLEAGTRLLLDKETITPEDFPELLPEVTRQAAE
jgi:cell division protease FtsH